MNERYELWDIEAGNLVDSFADVEDSLGVVGALLDAYGDWYADDLELTERDDAGVAHRRASGDHLQAMVAERRDRVPTR